MKTLIVYENVPEGPTLFFFTDGDRQELNGCFVNTVKSAEFDPKIREEVGNGVENEHWSLVKAPLVLPVQNQQITVVNCGFVS